MIGSDRLLRERYELKEALGSGGQGEVFRAFDHQHDRPVAIKVRSLPPDDERQAMLREAKTLLTLTPHPGLPLVRDDFFDGDRYCIVMEWVDGRTLAEVLRTRGSGLPVSEAGPIVEQVAAALHHLHAHDPPIVHRDVKPANVVLRPDGLAVLVDFGLSGPGGFLKGGGTAGYAAPELMSGGPVTTAADVFGLAATAVALLTGRVPDGVPPDWKRLGGDDAARVEEALRTGLSIDPARRQGSVLEIAAALSPDDAGAVLADAHANVRPGPSAEAPRRARRRRRRGLVALAAVLVVALVAGIAGLAGAFGGDPPPPAQAHRGVGLVVGSIPGDAMDAGAREGLGRAKDELHLRGGVVNASGSALYQAALLRMARQGYDPVIGLTDTFDLDGGALDEFPDTTFVLLTGAGPSPGDIPPNVATVEFRTEEAGYLAGYLSGLVAHPGDERRAVVGTVSPGSVPEIDRFLAGFGAGAREAAPGTVVLHEYSGSFVDPDACAKAARSQIRAGARVLFVVAGPCGSGAVEAARAAGVWAVTAVTDQPGPGVLTTAVKDFSALVDAVITQTRRGRLTGGEVASFGLSDGAVGLGTISPDVPRSLVQDVVRVEDRLRAGDIEGIPTST